MLTRLYLVRHVETESNKTKCFQGQSNAGISDVGKMQLEWISDRFKNIEYDILYTSPLKRAVLTAQAVHNNRNVDFIEKNELMEINGGDLEGKSMEWFAKTYPDLFHKISNDLVNFVAPNGESFVDLYKRVTGFIDNVIKENKNKTVVCVGHGLAFRTAICHLSGYTHNDIAKIHLGQNTAVTYAEFDDNLVPKIIYSNDNSHIPEEHRVYHKDYFVK